MALPEITVHLTGRVFVVWVSLFVYFVPPGLFYDTVKDRILSTKGTICGTERVKKFSKNLGQKGQDSGQ